MRHALSVFFLLWGWMNVQAQLADTTLRRIRALPPAEQVRAVTLVPYDAFAADLPGMRRLIDHANALIPAIKDTMLRADLHSKEGTVAYLEGNYDRSAEATMLAIGLYHAKKNLAKEGNEWCGLGYQTKRRDMDKALSYMRTGLALLTQTTDTGLLNPAFSNYGVLMEMTGKLDSAVHYYQKTLLMQMAVHDSLGLPFSLNKLGGVHLLRGDYPAALTAFRQAQAIRQRRHDRYGLQENIIYLGDYYMASGRPDSARWYFTRAADSSFALNIPYQRQYCYEQLIKVCRAQGDLGAALDFSLRHSALKDSLMDADRNRRLAEAETRFGTAQKENENLELRNRQVEHMAALARQRMWLALLIGLLVLSVALGQLALMWRRQRERARTHALLIDQKQRRLDAIISAQETERSHIARDLHDGAVQTLTGIKMRLQALMSKGQVPASAQDELKRTVAEMDAASAEVRAISHRMMPRALAEAGLPAAIDDMLGLTLGRAGILYTFDRLLPQGARFDPKVELVLFRMAQELVNNVLRHAQATEVNVQLRQAQGALTLLVEDNGRGFDPEGGTSGMGMTNLRTRAEAIGATLSIESSPGKGTLVQVRVGV